MRIYLDHNATTPLREEARERWLEVAASGATNASSLHAAGRSARAIVDDARERIAAALGVRHDELTFTSGGTESNNLALAGAVLARSQDGRGARLVTSPGEHSSVLETARSLASRGADLGTVALLRTGAPDPASLEIELAKGCDVLSLTAANNEVGALTDLARARAAAGAEVVFHTDAVQALGRLAIDLEGWGVDLASFSAHKVGGPLGVGVLWRRKGIALEPLHYGGGQENELRPGTENVPAIAAAAVAIELAVDEQRAYAERASELVAAMWHDLDDEAHAFSLLGPPLDVPRLPNTLCIRVPHTDGRVLVTRLDLEGVEASAGSACASGSLEPSHVLLAMGYDENDARAGLRLSVGRNTSRDECKRATAVLRNLVRASRAR